MDSIHKMNMNPIHRKYPFEGKFQKLLFRLYRGEWIYMLLLSLNYYFFFQANIFDKLIFNKLFYCNKFKIIKKKWRFKKNKQNNKKIKANLVKINKAKCNKSQSDRMALLKKKQGSQPQNLTHLNQILMRI